MNKDVVLIIPLHHARFCTNCQSVFYLSHPTNGVSPCCESVAWVYLTEWIKPLKEAE